MTFADPIPFIMSGSKAPPLNVNIGPVFFDFGSTLEPVSFDVSETRVDPDVSEARIEPVLFDSPY